MIVRHRGRRALRAAVAIVLATGAGACSWFTDFKQQPKIDPWESINDSTPPRGNPQGSVPVYGSAAPGFQYDRANTPAAIDAMASLQNPVPADARSLNNGRINYQINCAVCHGALGRGDGPAIRFGVFPFPLTNPFTANRPDGYYFGMIRNGRNNMPPYNRIEEADRWDIINYIRSLQGRTGAAPDTSHGRPGETGPLVPGASTTAPTRPAPYYHFVYPQAGAPMPGAAAAAAPPAAPVTPADSARPRAATDSARQRQP